MMSGCQETSCALEIAGALATDEVVTGSLGRVGKRYVLTMSRIQSRDARVLGRSDRRFDRQGREALLDETGAILDELYGKQAPAAAPAASTRSIPALVGRALGLTGMVLNVPPLLLCGLLAAAVGVVFVYDLARQDRSVHRLTQVQGFLANTTLLVAVLGLPPPVVAGTLAAVLFGTSWVVP